MVKSEPFEIVHAGGNGSNGSNMTNGTNETGTAMSLMANKMVSVGAAVISLSVAIAA